MQMGVSSLKFDMVISKINWRSDQSEPKVKSTIIPNNITKSRAHKEQRLMLWFVLSCLSCLTGPFFFFPLFLSCLDLGMLFALHAGNLCAHLPESNPDLLGGLLFLGIIVLLQGNTVSRGSPLWHHFR